MNELLLLFQIFFLVAFTFGAFRLGKDALIALFCLEAILANLFVLKQVTFFGLTVTASEGFAVSAFLALNLLREYFGLQEAKRGILICFGATVFAVGLNLIHLCYQGAFDDAVTRAYTTLLAPQARIVGASVLAFGFVQFLDLKVWSRLPQRWAFWRRNFFTSCISLSADTLIFTIVGLVGLIACPVHVCLFSFTIKMISLLCTLPLSAWMIRLVKKPA